MVVQSDKITPVLPVVPVGKMHYPLDHPYNHQQFFA